jgi:hypothetical protein
VVQQGFVGFDAARGAADQVAPTHDGGITRQGKTRHGNGALGVAARPCPQHRDADGEHHGLDEHPQKPNVVSAKAGDHFPQDQRFDDPDLHTQAVP